MRRSGGSRLLRVVDVAVPVVVGGFLVVLALEPEDPVVPKIFGVLVGAVQGAALWWRRSHPDLVMGIALGGGLLFVGLAPLALFPYAGLIALGSLAAARAPHRSLPALAALLGVTALNYRSDVHPAEDVTFAMMFPVVAWALGEATRNRRVAIAEEARRAVSEEQARIARELHDVIAHSVSVIVVQAAAADDVFSERPEQARAALRSIEAAGRDALAELRRVLAAVHAGDDGEPAPPQPGLGRLAELAEPLRGAGLEVVLRDETAVAAVPAGVQLSAFRIVQEALTNTLRHAGATRVEVTVRTCGGMLELDVRDDGQGAAARGWEGAGRGMAGMRERAAILGGTLDAGPLPDGGGFRVRARLPLEAPR